MTDEVLEFEESMEVKRLIRDIQKRSGIKCEIRKLDRLDKHDVFRMAVSRVSKKECEESIVIWPGNATIELLDIDKKHKQVLIQIREKRKSRALTVYQSMSEKDAKTKYGDRLIRWSKNSVRFYKQITGKKRTILFGKDETHYFVSEIRGKVRTVQEAHVKLIPSHLRGCKGLVRQGEWFFRPVTKKELSRLRMVDTHHVTLYRDLSSHIVEMHLYMDDFTHNEQQFVRGTITHPRHATLQFNNWMRCFRNTEVVDPDGLDGVD